MSALPSPQSSSPARWIGVLCVLAVLSIWTSFIVVARASAALSLSAFDIAWLRFVFSGLIALPLVLWRWRSMVASLGGNPALAWRRGAVLSLVAGVGYCSLAYSGFFFAPAAHAAVLMPGSLPLWSALFALLLLGEALTAARVAGLTLILAGGLLVGGSSLLASLSGAGYWRGDLLFLAAGMTWALYGVLCQRWRVRAIDATLAVAAGSFLLAAPPYALAVAAGWVPSGLASASWGEILFQAAFQGGLGMLVAGVAFTQVVTTFGPVRTTMVTALVPSMAALAAVPMLGEALSAPALGGLVCVTLGLLVGAGVLARPRRAVVGAPT